MKKRLLIPLVVLLIVPLQLLTHQVVAQTVGGQGFLTVTPTSLSSATGENIYVTVTGLAPGQAYQVCITQLNSCVSAVTGSTGGLAIGTLYVPAGTQPGVYTVQANPSSCCGRPTATGSFTVTAPPQAVLGQVSGQYGTAVPGKNAVVSGSGWTPGLEVSVCLQGIYGSNPLSCNNQVIIQPNGTFGFQGVSLYIPVGTPSGQYQVVAYYNSYQSLGYASTTLTVRAQNATCAIAQASVVAGGQVTVQCSNLTVGSASVQFQNSAGNLVGQASSTVNSAGNSTIVVPVTPSAATGTYNVVVVNNGTAVTLSNPLTVIVTGSPTLDTENSVDPLTTLTFTGSNYGPCAVVTISGTATLNGGASQNLTAQTQADQNGTIGTGFACSGQQQQLAQITVPGAATGSITFTATATVNGTQVTSNSEVVNVIAGEPQISLNEYRIVSGSPVTVSVSGFLAGNGASTNPIIITATYYTANGVQNNAPQQVVYPGANGSGSVTVTIPTDANGIVTITAYQQVANINISNSQLTATMAPPTPTPTNTPTPTPTNTPTPTPTATPTPTPIPPNPTPTPQPKMKISKIGVQFANVRQGTSNTLNVTANQGGNISVTVTIQFPNGSKKNYSGNTKGSSHFSLKFPIPSNAGTGQALVTVRLQKGQRGVTGFAKFTVV